jgi:hypothetical protein
MLKQTSKSFRKVFILEFTKELIKNTEKYKELTIKNKVKKTLKNEPKKEIKEGLPQKEQLKQIVHEKIKGETKRISKLKKEEPLLDGSVESIKKEFRKEPKYISALQKNPRFFPPLYIQAPALPETVRHIRPVPVHKEIDLGKLNPLINDPSVKMIECFSPEKKIVVSGTMGRKNTPVILTEEEINEVIKRFSEASKIPVNEGIFNVVFGRLHLASIISGITPPKFIIRKMPNLPPVSAVPYH